MQCTQAPFYFMNEFSSNCLFALLIHIKRIIYCSLYLCTFVLFCSTCFGCTWLANSTRKLLRLLLSSHAKNRARGTIEMRTMYSSICTRYKYITWLMYRLLIIFTVPYVFTPNIIVISCKLSCLFINEEIKHWSSS